MVLQEQITGREKILPFEALGFRQIFLIDLQLYLIITWTSIQQWDAWKATQITNFFVPVQISFKQNWIFNYFFTYTF